MQVIKKHCVRRQQKYLSQTGNFGPIHGLWVRKTQKRGCSSPGPTVPVLCCAGLLCCSEITPAPVTAGLALICSSGSSVSLHHHFPLYPLIKSTVSCPGEHTFPTAAPVLTRQGSGLGVRARDPSQNKGWEMTSFTPNLGKAILSAPDPYLESLWSRQD